MPRGLDNFTFWANDYWCNEESKGSTKACTWNQTMTWAAWQARGKDAGSVVADPQCSGAGGCAGGQVAPSSPALPLGFKPIDLSTVGPRGSVGVAGAHASMHDALLRGSPALARVHKLGAVMLRTED